ncbi:MAG TPA: hypothetical protein PKD37_07600 [Oligoflexia bacterium]|nr:hypothetical protein [Oligoflexia bacterium]HMP27827.1 hypothetical protein [Oligoflexia bacterium]
MVNNVQKVLGAYSDLMSAFQAVHRAFENLIINSSHFSQEELLNRLTGALKALQPESRPEEKLHRFRIYLPSISLSASFCDKYQVEVSDDLVKFTIPKGSSYKKFLNDAQKTAAQEHGRSAINLRQKELQDQLNSRTRYKAKLERDFVISYDLSQGETIILDDLKFKKLPDDERNKLLFVSAVAAHAAFFVATGKDLFGGRSRKVECVNLKFMPAGLSVISDDLARHYEFKG